MTDLITRLRADAGAWSVAAAYTGCGSAYTAQLERDAAAEIERLHDALERAFNELDDILEDWQLEGRHRQPRYEQLKRETDAARIALKSGERPPSETKPKRAYYETHDPPHCPTCGCGR